MFNKAIRAACNFRARDQKNRHTGAVRVVGANAARGILRREHIVAACLVGSVVVILGFASGLGLRSSASGEPHPHQPRTGDGQPVRPTDGQLPQGGEPPQGWTGSAYTGVPVTTQPGVQPTGSHQHPVPPGGTAPTSTPPPGQTCQPGALPTWLSTTGDTLGRTPVLGGLLPSLPGLPGLPVAPSSSAPVPG